MRQSSHIPDSSEDASVDRRSFSRYYVLVLGELAVLIGLFYWFMKAFE